MRVHCVRRGLAMCVLHKEGLGACREPGHSAGCGCWCRQSGW